MSNKDMVVVGNVRYRYEDARRLGLISDGKAITANSRNRNRTTEAPNGLINRETAGSPSSPPAASQAQVDADNQLPPARPAKSGSKAEWLKYALTQGKTAEELDGLTSDQIIEAVPAEGDGSGENGD